jgi:diguanylate cyclase (GGDEF)-like protein/PAS domain S-box-containing protein
MDEDSSRCRVEFSAWTPARRLFLFFGAALLGAALLLGIVLRQTYIEAERQAALDAGNLTSVLEARLGDVFRRIHADLDELAATLPSDALRPGAGLVLRGRVSHLLALHAKNFEEIVGFRVLDARGEVIYASEGEFAPASAGDRDYFRELERDPGLAYAFSGVITGRISKRLILIMAVPIRNIAGGFEGVVMAPIDLGVMQRLFESLNLGEQGVLTLRRSDNGRLALRRPLVEAKLNGVLHDNPMHRRVETGEMVGTIRFNAAIDGTDRVYSYRRIAGYPFYVAAGIAVDDFLAAWRKMALMAGLAALVLALALALGLIRLLRAEREEASSAERLAESEARYRMLAENSHDVIWTLDISSRRFSYISPSVEQLRGYSVAEALAQPLEATLTPASAELMLRDIDQRLRRIAAGDPAARVLSCEVDQLRKDGGAVPTEVVTTLLLDGGGVPRSLLGISRDIGERRAAERALRETNQRLQTQLEEIGRLQVALKEQAIRDALTGLYNRRYLDETLEREVSRARREGAPLSLVMLDIDHFKRVNDTYGHQAGDEALKMLARTLLADIRTEDVACRYGGEEFLILLPRMPLDAARMRAEGWRRSVEDLILEHGEFPIRFTISLGVAAYPEHGKTPDDLTRRADQALYCAKAGGRNRVEVVSG